MSVKDSILKKRKIHHKSTALLAIIFLISGCAHYQVKVTKTEAPYTFRSLGATGVYVDVKGIKNKSQNVTIKIDDKQSLWFLPASIRLARWDQEKKAFDFIKNSRFDEKTGLIKAKISQNGIYGVFGYSRMRRVYDYQMKLCELRNLHLGTGRDFIPPLCLVILCPGFDVQAWGAAWSQQTGMPVSPKMMDGYFQNICDLCLGGSLGSNDCPECGIGEIIPGGNGFISPPELEQMRINIPNGGRAVAIAVHPSDNNKMVVASETGGLFLTTSRGTYWRHVSADTVFDYTDVQYLPTNPDIIVASAKRDFRVVSGGGIWRSPNGGESWTKASVTAPNETCGNNLSAFGLDYEPEGNRLWAGTSCGVAYSDDEGATWQYLPPAPGYNYDKVYAILTPSRGHIKILTDAGVKVTTNGGSSWSSSNRGLPSYINKQIHNQIAVSPFDHTDIYWAFSYWMLDTDGNWKGRRGLYLSTDNGASWTIVIDSDNINRPPFVRIGKSLSSIPNQYDVYYGDGGNRFKRITVTHGTSPSFSSWTNLTVDHADVSDLAFDVDGKIPLLLASDGGLHKTFDNGLTWVYTGNEGNGYNALQITEVIGQKHYRGNDVDLYFGTQDNDIWASPNTGVNWIRNRCCEGFFFNIPREYFPPDVTRLTGVSCWGCGNFISERLLVNQRTFPNAPNSKEDHNPRLLKPGFYIQNTEIDGVDSNIFNLTRDITDASGVRWEPRYGFPNPVKDLSKIAGKEEDLVVFTAVKIPGITPTGEERIGIKRITGVLAGGTPEISDVTGFGSLGKFPTMFAWYKPFGVDPNNPNYFLVPDIISETVKVSINGGERWESDDRLRTLVTNNDEFLFRIGTFVQISSFGFDPECDGHILVGTRQSGIFRTFNDGATWEKVRGSEVIPRVSSFFFTGKGEVIISSYGRGLWRLRYECHDRTVITPGRDLIIPHPVLYIRGSIIPLRDINNTGDCPKCGFFLVSNGQILDYVIDKQTKQVKEVFLSSGKIRGYSYSGKEIKLPFKLSIGQYQGYTTHDELLCKLLEAKNSIKGLYLEGEQFKGVLLAEKDITTAQLPKKKILAPYIVVDLPSTHGASLQDIKSIQVTGYGFDPHYPLTFSLDGVQLKNKDKPTFDNKGKFKLEILPILDVGGHTLRVEQKTDKGVVRDAYTFNVTVQDSPK